MSRRELKSTAQANWQGKWKNKSPICIGDRIQYIGRGPGEKKLGIGKEPHIQWLRGNDIGVVVEIIRGYAPHACPNHYTYPDCICGNDSARVLGQDPAPVVNYKSQEGGVVPRCIAAEEEGIVWLRL